MMNDERERAMPTLNNESNLNDEKVGNAHPTIILNNERESGDFKF